MRLATFISVLLVCSVETAYSQAAQTLVINEVHYNPSDNTVLEEFIELHNPTTSTVDVASWVVRGAVDLVLPSNSLIPAGGFLVCARDPATIQARYGVSAVGPWQGSLSSEGEKINLENAAGGKVDEVDYNSEFPWPVMADGGGASMELVHPSLDNDLGSSWRSSRYPLPLSEMTYVPLQSTKWSWRPGNTEASSPPDAWRQQGFVQDGSWVSGVQLPIGYGTVDGVPLNTTISGMQNNYTCIFLRKTFTIAPGELPSQLLIHSTSDDGFVMWINGVEMERRRFTGEPAVGLLAQNQGSEGSYETRTVLNIAGDLVAGTNTIAVQLINTTLHSSDIGFDVELKRPGQDQGVPIPSPGQENTAFADNAAPNIRKVNHTPQQPAAIDTVLIAAKVTDPDGIQAVHLEYQVVAPGAYVPAKLSFDAPNIPTAQDLADNPAYQNGWISVVMEDNGTGGDVLAGDDIFSVTLPAQGHRTLVRYRITVTDGLGLGARVPYADDPSLNFAYFVYDGVPGYNGHSIEVMNSLPVYHVITRNEDWDECIAYNIADQIAQGTQVRFYYNWPGTFVYDGIVYDNIRYRLRGANGRYHRRGKRSMRFRMNKGHYFQARDQSRKKYPRKWRTLTTGKGFENQQTLTYGLNEAVNMYLWNKIGLPASRTHWVHFRVVDGAAEAPDQWRGDFYGLNFVQETYDVRFLEAHGMEKGNLYKLINQTTDPIQQQRYQAATAVSDGSDHNNIEYNLDGYDSAATIRAHVNLEKYYLFHALSQAVRHNDFWPAANKNMVYYFEPDYRPENGNLGKLWLLPWDTDASWGPAWFYGHDVVYNTMFDATGVGSDNATTPELWPEYFNAVREIRDLIWQEDQMGPLLEEFAGVISGFEAADADRWKGAPWDAGNYDGLGGKGAISLAALVQDMMDFAFVGGTWPVDTNYLSPTIGPGGRAAYLDTLQASHGEGSLIPNTPTISYVGEAGFPANGLAFQCSNFSDPQGSGSFGAQEWRLAEITDDSSPHHDPAERFKLEWDSVWESGTLTSWSNRITIPGLVVDTNRVYRARVRHQDTTGRWSHWSNPVEFSVTAVDLVSVLRQNLRFSEIMYHPPSMSPFTDDDLEFLEIQNMGVTPLDLGGLTFTDGINFTFPNDTTLGAGQHFLLGRNAAALQAKYPGIVVNGLYTGKLDNSGETLRLSTPTDIPILEVTYRDSPPWPVTADGMGWSLVLDDAWLGTYRVSSALGGSPNNPDPATTLVPVVVTELLTHTDLPQIDTIELHNPTASPVDIGGWFLTDKKDVPKKFRIPDGTTIGPGGYLTYDQSQYDAHGLAFNLSSLGDDCYLFSGAAATNLTGYVHAVPFGAAANGVSFGRVVNSVGMEDFVAMSGLTLGTNNSRPKLGPVIITEIMFHPPLLGTNENYDAEFIELQNVTAADVPLYSADFPSNTWKLGNGVSYLFPTNVTLAVGGRLLVVSFDPVSNPTALNTFRATHSVPTNTPVFGPWTGHLDNDGEAIELKFPDRPELDGFVPYVMVEKVSYLPVSPWPSTAAGAGHSLQRATLLEYANDPVNWFSAAPSVGTLSSQTSQDVDGDDMPDVWELAYGTDPYSPDASLDPDGDGFSNFSECVAGTDPLDPTSLLKWESSGVLDGGIQLRFTAIAGHSYSVQTAGAPHWTTWNALTNIPVMSSSREITLHPRADGTEFYRLVTPAQP